MKILVLLACTLAPSWLRLFVWRGLGFRVARGAKVSMFSVVVADHVDMAAGAVIEPLSFIYRPASIRLGERARIGSFVRIIGWRGEVVLGPQTFVALGCLIDSTGGFELGARSCLGPRCMCYSHGETGLIYNVRYPHRNGPVRIGEDVWVGMGCVIQSRVTIGSGAIVLAGLTIRSDVPAGQSVVPTMQEERMVSTERLIGQTTDQVRQQTLDDAFRRFTSSGFGATVRDEDEDLWSARNDRGQTVYLIRAAGARLPDASAGDAVAWTLTASHVSPGAVFPVFVFDELTIHGSHTKFAEYNAEALMRQAGAHFVFAAGRPAPE